MELKTTKKYTIVSPEGIYIKGVRLEDIVGIHSFLRKEGCKESENLFTDEEKAVSLDTIQIHRASISGASVESSMDMLLCVYRNKIFLAEAKFRVENVRNLSKHEIDDKIKGTKDIVEDEIFQIMPIFYVLFSSTTLTQTRKNELKKKFLSSPRYQFKTAIEFYNLFEH